MEFFGFLNIKESEFEYIKIERLIGKVFIHEDRLIF